MSPRTARRRSVFVLTVAAIQLLGAAPAPEELVPRQDGKGLTYCSFAKGGLLAVEQWCRLACVMGQVDVAVETDLRGYPMRAWFCSRAVPRYERES